MHGGWKLVGRWVEAEFWPLKPEVVGKAKVGLKWYVQ